MKKTTNKKAKSTNIEDLASLMEKGFKRQDNNLESLAIMTAKGFTNLESRISDVESHMVTKIEFNKFKDDTTDSFQKIHRDIMSIGDRFVSRHEFDKFVSRFNALEAKVKGRK